MRRTKASWLHVPAAADSPETRRTEEVVRSSPRLTLSRRHTKRGRDVSLAPKLHCPVCSRILGQQMSQFGDNHIHTRIFHQRTHAEERSTSLHTSLKNRSRPERGQWVLGRTEGADAMLAEQHHEPRRGSSRDHIACEIIYPSVQILRPTLLLEPQRHPWKLGQAPTASLRSSSVSCLVGSFIL